MKVLFIECHNGRTYLDWIREAILDVDPSAKLIPFINRRGNERLQVIPIDMDVIVIGPCCGRGTLNAEDRENFDAFVTSGGIVIGIYIDSTDARKRFKAEFMHASKTIKFYQQNAKSQTKNR